MEDLPDLVFGSLTGGLARKVDGGALRPAFEALDHGAGTPVSPEEVALLADVFRSATLSDREALIAHATATPARAERLSAELLPAIVARVGEDWLRNRVSFVDVTLCASNVHAALRAADRMVTPPSDAESVVLVCPPGETHGLAVMLAAHRFRRLGVHVRVLMEPSPADVARTADALAAKMIAVSASCSAGAASAFNLIRGTRAIIGGRIPVIFGGGALARDMDFRRNAGADWGTNDPEVALRYCRIDTRAPSGAGPRTTEGFGASRRDGN